ncbi:MAG TPA: serine/threonine protein kinase, partial [Planctomycetes bacterium]|nr:serine/threonine protein kinase [Planctomycetota bacterium]
MSHCEPNSSIAGRFAPVSLLGRGAMGEVWLARERVSGPQVALKLVSPEDSMGPVGARHRREYLNLSCLRHPSILQVYDYGVDHRDGARWFSSEVLRGPVSGELAGNLSLHRWLEMCQGILSPLAFLHRNGWVHGDIKSDNVRFRDVPRDESPLDPVLLDFGLSHLQGYPQEHKILGTPHSMPPEQWLGEPPDSRGDVYSAGILFYQLWCGRLPFTGNERSRLGRAHLQEDPPALDQLRAGLPAEVIEWLQKMLEKRPDDRPQDAGEVRNLLDKVCCRLGVKLRAESCSSLASQVRYGGPSRVQTDALFEALMETVEGGQDGGIVVHLHRRGGDRRRIARSVRTHLMARGIPVIAIDPDSATAGEDVARKVVSGTEVAIAVVEQPGLGSAELRSALECSQIGSCTIIWWVNCSSVPSGYLGEVIAKRPTRKIQTDALEAMDLGD